MAEGEPDFDALQARLRARADEAKEKARLNRERAPEFAAFVADFKRVFGDDTRVTWVRWPDGTEEGKRRPPGVVPVLPIKEPLCPTPKPRSRPSKRR